MKRSERTYSQLFGLLRETPPATSFTPEEILSLIEQPPAEPGVRSRLMPMPRGRSIAIALVLLAISSIALWLRPSGAPSPDRISTPPLAGRTVSPEPGSPPAPEPADPAPATMKDGKGDIVVDGRKQKIHPAARGASSGAPSAYPATRQGMPGEMAPMHAGSDTTEGAPSRQAGITSFPMLELSRDELKAIGVTFVDGKVETACEEYYTLATEQDRAQFARMGIDTTKRTGIVRMHLTIDTFGLTTLKHAWTRVENYSRIAPIIVLNSYVADAHGKAVVLNSFSHSPIMDLAKRSIDSMVTFLPEALASNKVDRIMHDSDQANPGRILVPVHIRLGDEPISGSTKRRGADIILWYYPTAEFTGALPARYRLSLQRELNVLADVVECNLPSREACRQITGEPLLVNYCKRTSGALSALNVSPNPAHGSVSLRYMLEGERTVAATLYGMHGEFVRELLPATTVRGGVHSVSVEMGKVISGAYLVVLRTERGEQVSERLIVQ